LFITFINQHTIHCKQHHLCQLGLTVTRRPSPEQHIYLIVTRTTQRAMIMTITCLTLITDGALAHAVLPMLLAVIYSLSQLWTTTDS